MTASATALFIEENQSELGQYRGAALSIDPTIGMPQRDFVESLSQLNAWTNTPFQARYPEVGKMIDGEVDIAYLHYIGCYLQAELMKIATQANSPAN